MKENKLIISPEIEYSLDTHRTCLNNNVLVVGTSGSGKTQGLVKPNLHQAVGSYVVSDPKGRLYQEFSGYLRKRGYVVKILDFTDPQNSCGYNPFQYIHSDLDVLKVAHMLTYTHGENGSRALDPFWDDAAELLLAALIGYLREDCSVSERTLPNVYRLLDMLEFPDENDAYVGDSPLDILFKELKNENPDSYASCLYSRFRTAAFRTLRSIMITAISKFAIFDNEELRTILQKDDTDIGSIGRRKTAVFVTVSDTDRSLDPIANLFYTQAMNELCRVADKDYDGRLPVPVRFILDDFATNCQIAQMPRLISCIRSREISTMLMIQAEAQLRAIYGEDGRTIVGNCDTYVYLGGADLETARSISERADVPLQDVLNMPLGKMWVFRRGERPRMGRICLFGIDKDRDHDGDAKNDKGRAYRSTQVGFTRDI